MIDPSSPLEAPPPERRLFCNRTLNMRAIRAVGFDMDYTLVHYRVELWEKKAYERARQALLERGWPVEALVFDPSFVILGLVLDLELGNLVKASRFGYVSRAYHGTRQLEFEQQRDRYSRVLVDLRERRWVFLNTLFSLSEALLYMQCVDLLDSGKLEPGIGYADLYEVVRGAVDRTHTEGDLKAEIAARPDDFVELDPLLPLTLLDFKHSGKLLMLLTNSEWSFTRAMMAHAIDRFLPSGSSWRELFDVVVVAARKPDFFTARSPMFEVVDEDRGQLRPHSGPIERGRVYFGGNREVLERHLGMRPEEILYVGDHLYSDVHVTKNLLRWRTALVLRDIEKDVEAVESFRGEQLQLSGLMAEKERLEHELGRARLAAQRLERGYGSKTPLDERSLGERMQSLRLRVAELDQRIVPLATRAGELANRRWGLLMRSGVDKSYFARQVERYADVYTSRVSNFAAQGPYLYLRAPRVSLPHDEACGPG